MGSLQLPGLWLRTQDSFIEMRLANSAESVFSNADRDGIAGAIGPGWADIESSLSFELSCGDSVQVLIFQVVGSAGQIPKGLANERVRGLRLQSKPVYCVDH